MGKALLKYLKRIAITAGVLYIAICALMYFFQDKLLFHPQPRILSESSAFLKQYPDFDTLSLPMSDGTRLGLYLSKDSGSGQRPLVIYFGGNAEEVSHIADYRKHFPGCRLALVNYRGYGRSQGSPSEQTMFSDALGVYDYFAKQQGIDRSQIILTGRSIGTGVVTYLASQRHAKAVVLITPYESMTAVAGEKYPFVPVSLLLKHRFESERYAKTIASPVLALIAKNDRVIPKAHAYKLLEHWKGTHTAFELDADHNSIMSEEQLWKGIEDFIRSLD